MRLLMRNGEPGLRSSSCQEPRSNHVMLCEHNVIVPVSPQTFRGSGHRTPAKVFEVLARPSADVSAREDMLDAYHEGRERLTARDWTGAIAAFGRAIESGRDDNLTQVMLDRAHKVADEPPGEEWDGVWQGSAKVASAG